MRAGKLRHRITLQARASGQDASGQQLDTWSDVHPCWSEIRPLSGREHAAAAAINAEVTHAIEMRYAPGITPALRIVFGSRIFAIASVLDVEERHHELVLICTEGTTTS